MCRREGKEVGFHTLFADKVNFERARLILAHLLVSVSLAEDVELDVFEPDAVLGSSAQPSRRLRLMGNWKSR